MVAANEEAVPVSPHRMGTAGTVWAAHMFPVVGDGLTCNAGTAHTSASKSSNRRFVITEKAPTRAFSWLKAATRDDSTIT